MKKQTAVEYLIQEIKNDVFVHSKSTKEWNHIFRQAEAMEKEQMEEAKSEGYEFATQEAIKEIHKNYRPL